MSDTLASGSPTATHSNRAGLNSPVRVLFASLVGTTIEFFDFYVYATAAVLVFPTLFFPNNDPTTALLASFGSGWFAVWFLVRYLKRRSLAPFVLYRLALAAVVLAVWV